MTTLRATLALVDSAVLAPLYRDADGRLRLVFIRRSPFGVHGGQIAFPGGRREAEDPDLLTTALRESEEEIGLDRNLVEVPVDLLEGVQRLTLPASADLLEIGVNPDPGQIRALRQDGFGGAPRAQHRTAVDRGQWSRREKVGQRLGLAAAFGRQAHARQPTVQQLARVMRLTMPRQPDRGHQWMTICATV